MKCYNAQYFFSRYGSIEMSVSRFDFVVSTSGFKLLDRTSGFVNSMRVQRVRARERKEYREGGKSEIERVAFVELITASEYCLPMSLLSLSRSFSVSVSPLSNILANLSAITANGFSVELYNSLLSRFIDNSTRIASISGSREERTCRLNIC